MYGLRIIAVLVVVALAGCAGGAASDKLVAVYTGPERPADQVAQLQCGFGINVRAIDGNSQYQGKALLCTFALLPGQHEFRVNLEALDTKRGGYWRSEKDYIVPLKLAAGRTYSLNAFLDQEKGGDFPWNVKLIDNTTNSMITITDVRPAQ
jgi:hypothetical protein